MVSPRAHCDNKSELASYQHPWKAEGDGTLTACSSTTIGALRAKGDTPVEGNTLGTPSATEWLLVASVQSGDSSVGKGSRSLPKQPCCCATRYTHEFACFRNWFCASILGGLLTKSRGKELMQRKPH
eukprot:4470892-Amphidinium_carterae.2